MSRPIKSFQHKKDLGQHFLQQESIAEDIVELLHNDSLPVLEIGPGAGILTKYLLEQKTGALFLSEIDDEVILLIRQKFDFPQERILRGDFLRYPLDDVFKDQFTVIGNFPYNISSQIIFRVIEFHSRVPQVVGMFQKEMAQRLAAQPHSKDFGVITAWAQLHYDVAYHFEIPPDAFYQPPKVFSAVVSLNRKATPPDLDTRQYLKVVKMSFSQRRKKISNCLKGLPGAHEALGELELAHLRAEDLEVADFVKLTQLIFK